MELKICHLYPDALNLYGDGGNVTCLRRRLEWRGIQVSVDGCGIGQELKASQYDLFVIGAGQHFEQGILLEDLRTRKASEICSAVRDGKTFLAICGGLELMGNSYEAVDGTVTELVGAVDMYTVEKKKRLTGDCVFAVDELDGLQVIGFENHSGRLYLGSTVRPLGRVISGYGNNGEDGTEGVRCNNFFGSYGHGCLLPKNPVFADYILKTALTEKYGNAELTPLDDSLELSARQFMLNRIFSK